MSCTLEFHESLIKTEFCSKGNKQRILIDILTKYGEMDLNKLAFLLDVSVEQLQEIFNGNGFLIGEQADTLAQMFLMFFGKQFFRKCTLIRDFRD